MKALKYIILIVVVVLVGLYLLGSSVEDGQDSQGPAEGGPFQAGSKELGNADTICSSFAADAFPPETLELEQLSGANFAAEFMVEQSSCGNNCQAYSVRDLREDSLLVFSDTSRYGAIFDAKTRLLVLDPPTMIPESSQEIVWSKYYVLDVDDDGDLEERTRDDIKLLLSCQHLPLAVTDLIKSTVANSLNIEESDFSLTIFAAEGNFLRASLVVENSGSTQTKSKRFVFLARERGQWKVVKDATSGYSCSEMDGLGFPRDMYQDCVES